MNYKKAYRGFSKRHNQWIYGTPCTDGTGGVYILEKGLMLQSEEVLPYSVQPFTGKLDQNGKEIYLGDVNQDSGVVIWSEDEAAFIWQYEGIEDMGMADEDTWCTIVGNIIENTELL